jgi:hypothetical protein
LMVLSEVVVMGVSFCIGVVSLESMNFTRSLRREGTGEKGKPVLGARL